MSKIHPLKYYDSNWKFVDTIKIHGYSFGDRLLEEVFFILKWDGKKYKFKEYADKYSNQYMKKLNEKMWIEKAEKYAKTTDIVSPLGEDDDLVRGAEIDDSYLEDAEKAQ